MEVARLLLEANADKDKPMNDGFTPLFIASQEGQLEVARLLLRPMQKRTRSNRLASPLCLSRLAMDSWRLYGFCWRPKRTRTRPQTMATPLCPSRFKKGTWRLHAFCGSFRLPEWGRYSCTLRCLGFLYLCLTVPEERLSILCRGFLSGRVISAHMP